MIEFVSELSYNHFGSTELLIRLIQQSKKAGADYIKFEKRSHKSYKSFKSLKMEYELDNEKIQKIIEICSKEKIGWFCSVRDLESAEFIKKFEPKKIKIASREAHSLDFIIKIVHLYRNSEYIISTGGMILNEIQNIYNYFKSNNILNQLTIVHSVSKYPHSLEESNINRIKIFKKLFMCKIGYSGHEEGFFPSFYASTLGIKYLERHFALDKNLVVKSKESYEDERCTMTPYEYKTLVDYVRSYEIAKNLKFRDYPLNEEIERLIL